MEINQVIAKFGPLKRIDRKREAVLMKQGKFRNVLTLIDYDVSYEDLPEDERPTDEELKERGETREEYTAGRHEAVVGHHLVNVSEIYESKKPMPEDLRIEDDGIWFGDDGLPES